MQKLVDLLPLNEKVHRTTIEAAYPRSNYARRIRKIVSEYGWDIERTRGKNGANDDWYIRRSDGPVRPQNIRQEVPKQTREKIYERDGWVCRLCGTSVGDEQDLTKPQCDHKVPAERSGSSKAFNLQTLCTQCNLKKRQSCKGCRLPSCLQCPLAFPEDFDEIFILTLTNEASVKLRQAAEHSGIPAEMIVSQLVETHYNDTSPSDAHDFKLGADNSINRPRNDAGKKTVTKEDFTLFSVGESGTAELA